MHSIMHHVSMRAYLQPLLALTRACPCAHMRASMHLVSTVTGKVVCKQTRLIVHDRKLGIWLDPGVPVTVATVAPVAHLVHVATRMLGYLCLPPMQVSL